MHNIYLQYIHVHACIYTCYNIVVGLSSILHSSLISPTSAKLILTLKGLDFL